MKPTRETWWLLAAWTSMLAASLIFWAAIAFVAWDIFR